MCARCGKNHHDLPEVVTAKVACCVLGIGRNRFDRLAKHGIIPALVDPDSGRRSYFVRGLREWARNNGRAA